MAHRVVSPALVGRDREFATLRAAVEAGGDRPIVIVAGDAGIGKTRLLRDVAAAAATTGRTTVAWGTCVRMTDLDLPFSPVAAMLDDLGRCSRDRVVRDAVDRARHEVLGGTDADRLQRAVDQRAGTRRLRVFDAVLAAILAVVASGSEHVLLVVDDVHWADRPTLDLVRFLARRLRPAPAVLMLGCRAEALRTDPSVLGFVQDLERDSVHERIDLDGLAPSDVALQVRAIEGDIPEEARRRDSLSIAARSGGNPFLVEELVRLPPDAAVLPAHLRDLLGAQLDSLDESARALVDAAAIVGRPVDEGLLSDVLGTGRATTRRALHAGIGAGVLVAHGDQVGFRHSLLLEAADVAIDDDARRRLHGAIAHQLEQRAGSKPEPGILLEVGRHWDLAGVPDKALPTLVRAGEAGARSYAWASAARAFERASVLAEQAGGGTADPVDLAARAGEMWFEASDQRRSQAQWRRAARVAGRLDRPGERSCAWAWVAYLYNELGGIERGYLLSEHLLRDLPALGDPLARMLVQQSAGVIRVFAGRFESGATLLHEVLPAARRLGCEREVAQTLSVLGHAAASLGDAQAAGSLYEAAISASPARDPNGIESAIVNRAIDAVLLGDWQEVRATLTHADRVVRTFGVDHEPGIRAYLFAIEADLGLQTGDLAGVLRTIDRAMASMLRDVHPYHELRASEAWAAALAGETGRAAAAIAAVMDCTWWCPWHRAYAETAQALLDLQDGRPEAARDACTSAIDHIAVDEGVPDPPRVGLVALRVAAALVMRARARGDGAALEEVRSWAAPVAHRLSSLAAGRNAAGGQLPRIHRARALLGVAEWAGIRGFADADPWRDAVAALDDVEVTWEAAYGRLRLAETLLRTARYRGEARRELGLAHAYAVGAGAAPLASDTRALAERGHVTLEEPAETASEAPLRTAALDRPDGLGRLSDRERAVLELVAAGRTNREIGETLFITSKTASSHVTHILDKLGVGSRVEAAILAAAAGIAEPSGRGREGSGAGGEVGQALPDAKSSART